MSATILTGVPTRSDLSPETDYCLAHRNDGFNLIRIQTMGLGVIEARNTIGAEMLEESIDPNQICLWCDDDAWFPPGTISKVVAAVKPLRIKTLVAGYFCFRREHCPPVAAKFPNHLAGPNPETDPDLCPVFRTGFHFVVHRLGLLQLLPEKPFSLPFEDCGWEDEAFCARLRSIGGQCFTLISAQVAHLDVDTGLAYLPYADALKIENHELIPYVKPRYRSWNKMAAARGLDYEVRGDDVLILNRPDPPRRTY